MLTFALHFLKSLATGFLNIMYKYDVSYSLLKLNSTFIIIQIIMYLNGINSTDIWIPLYAMHSDRNWGLKTWIR